MNSVHDLGGMHGMGPIEHESPESSEPVFHAVWEGRVYAMNRSLGAWHKWNINEWRYHIEQIAPSEYLRMSYYEKWLTAMERRVVQYGFVTKAELESGKAAPGFAKAAPPFTKAMASIDNREIPSAREPAIAPLFLLGQRVRVRNINPVGHTRCPRYARGKTGEIFRDHGVYQFPDTSARGLGDKRQHVYAVRFAARELWGESASPRDFIQIDLWDDYLEPPPVANLSF